MRSLKIHFTKNSEDKIFSRLIMWYEKSDFSHCALEFRLNKLNENAMYHSTASSGVNFSGEDIFLENNTIVYSFEVEVSDETYNSIMKNLIQNCGIKYAMMQNLGIFLVGTTKRLGINMTNPWNKGYNCSELVFREVLVKLDQKLQDRYDENLVTPKEVKEILERLNLLKIQG